MFNPFFKILSRTVVKNSRTARRNIKKNQLFFSVSSRFQLSYTLNGFFRNNTIDFRLFYWISNTNILQNQGLWASMNWRVCQTDAFGLFYTVLKCRFLIKGLEISNQEHEHEQLKTSVLENTSTAHQATNLLLFLGRGISPLLSFPPPGVWQHNYCPPPPGICHS